MNWNWIFERFELFPFHSIIKIEMKLSQPSCWNVSHLFPFGLQVFQIEHPLKVARNPYRMSLREISGSLTEFCIGIVFPCVSLSARGSDPLLILLQLCLPSPLKCLGISSKMSYKSDITRLLVLFLFNKKTQTLLAFKDGIKFPKLRNYIRFLRRKASRVASFLFFPWVHVCAQIGFASSWSYDIPYR